MAKTKQVSPLVERIRFLANKAGQRRRAWLDDLKRDTVETAHWSRDSRDGLEAAVVEQVCEQALLASHKQTTAELRQSCWRELRRVGSSPVASTGILDAFVQSCLVAAWIKIIDQIDEFGNESQKTGASNAKHDQD